MKIKAIYPMLLLLIGSLISTTGCYYDVEEELYGGCDTTGSTFSSTVAPMLQANGCLGCHAAPATAGNGIVLDNYASVSTLVQQNKFISGADRMPPSSAPNGILSDCDMNKLRAWVNAGALNN